MTWTEMNNKAHSSFLIYKVLHIIFMSMLPNLIILGSKRIFFGEAAPFFRVFEGIRTGLVFNNSKCFGRYRSFVPLLFFPPLMWSRWWFKYCMWVLPLQRMFLCTYLTCQNKYSGNKTTCLRVMAAGNMNRSITPTVPPVNWNAIQMLGMYIAP